MRRFAPLLFLIACRPESAPLTPSPPASPPAAPAASAPGAPPMAMPSADDLPVHGAAEAPAPPVSGVVKEVLPAGRYVYLRLERAVPGQAAPVEEWAAVLKADVAVGAQVTIATPFEKRDFDSPTLKRRFDRIWFGTLGGAPAAGGDPHAGMNLPAAADPHAGMNAAAGGDPHGGMAGHTAGGEAARPKALMPPPEGGLAIVDLRARAESLAGTTVTVRGMVTKSNEGIMGKNWLHVSDASGEGKDDLVVTTDGTAAVGDVVTVKGNVAVKQDFGYGYQYDVLLEKATVTVDPKPQ